MTNEKNYVERGVFVGCDYWDSPIRVGRQAFLRFNRRMDQQMHRLEVRWSFTASPAARGVTPSRAQSQFHYPK